MSTSDEMQLNGTHIPVEKRYVRQKRQRDSNDDVAENGLARDIKSLSISPDHQDDIYKYHKRLNKGPETKVKNTVKEIQIFIPTAEREATLCSEEESEIDKRKIRIRSIQRKRLRSLQETTNAQKQRHEDILLGKYSPKKRDKIKVSSSSLEFVSSSYIKDDPMSFSLNRLDKIINQRKLPRLKYQMMSTSSLKALPKVHSDEIDALGNSKEHLPVDHKTEVPNFFVSDFDRNSNNNNSNLS